MGDGNNSNISYMCMKMPKNKLNFKKRYKSEISQSKNILNETNSPCLLCGLNEKCPSAVHIFEHIYSI